MPKSMNARYWIFQMGGWGIFALVNLSFAYVFDQIDEHGILLCRLIFFVETGIILSHCMRALIRANSLLIKPINQQIILFLTFTLFFSVTLALGQSIFEHYYGLIMSKGEVIPFHIMYYRNLWSAFILLFIWNCIYFMYHYVDKSHRQQMDTLQLEALVKELELKTIKAHINPHFIFNALNSIRALIDENPVRARAAITELSNILRSSLSTDKGETVSLKDELRIVQDYLALENMRFEDRLKIEYEIDDETLDQQVPPMMLQTLVENAIKHGISKRVKGGIVKIISDFREDFHELAVQNTGNFNGYAPSDGFGVSSTQDRLNLLFGARASFEIRQVSLDLVEAKVCIPTELN